MKVILNKMIVFCFFIAGSSLSAQNRVKVGLDLGYTYSGLNQNLSNLLASQYTPNYGIGIKLSAEYMIWKSFFVSTGISFLQKNYEFRRTGSYSGWYTKYNNDFLNFPLLIGGYLLNNQPDNKGVWIKVAGGMYTDYWLSMKRNGRYPVFNEIQEDGSFNYTKVSDTYNFKKNENQLNRWGYGFLGQAQLGYSFKKLDVYGSYHYQYGLSDINKDNEIKNEKSTIRSYMISIGISYQFN